MKRAFSRALIEIAFIIFLFYANLLMGEYTQTGLGRDRGLTWALGNILTTENFAIATLAALVGYLVFEFLREKL